eukprot:6213362-Pleurochrysis_carterae.AAC.2
MHSADGRSLCELRDVAVQSRHAIIVIASLLAQPRRRGGEQARRRRAAAAEPTTQDSRTLDLHRSDRAREAASESKI